MRLFLLLLLFLPFIFLETTLSFLPVSLVLVFSVGLVSGSSFRFLFAFLLGLFFSLFFGGMLSLFIIFFLFEMGFASVYRSYFPGKVFLPSFLFILLEIAFFLIIDLTLNVFHLLSGYILFFIIFYFVKAFLKRGEGVQLQFDFLRL